MAKKDEYFAMMESQIKKWDAEVDNLNVEAKQMSADARARYEEQIKAMRADRDTRLFEIAGNAHGQRIGVATNAVRSRRGLDLDEERLGQGLIAVQEIASSQES